MSNTDNSEHRHPTRAFVGFPPNWQQMTEEEKEEAALQTAEAMARQLGLILTDAVDDNGDDKST
ncbi:MAG: hypothetical protein JOY68_02880 [Candidatus Dormibacteraeota bacterium]|nr:hypothetical protein [Candidatus Dormibacteraeota bacterium]